MSIPDSSFVNSIGTSKSGGAEIFGPVIMTAMVLSAFASAPSAVPGLLISKCVSLDAVVRSTVRASRSIIAHSATELKSFVSNAGMLSKFYFLEDDTSDSLVLADVSSPLRLDLDSTGMAYFSAFVIVMGTMFVSGNNFFDY
jgi:hypothetical protein